MKLATLDDNTLDGKLFIVSRDLKQCIESKCPTTMREAIENWDKVEKSLCEIYDALNAGKLDKEASPFDETKCHSPLPRSFGWMDGSAFIQHVVLVRRARNAAPPETLKTVPLMYQGGSDTFLKPYEDIPFHGEEAGTDLEAEVGIITDFVPMGIKEKDAEKHIKLITIINDVSLRGFIPSELAAGFGFFQSKPSSSFGPVAVTPDELQEHWKEMRVHLPLCSKINDEFFGKPNAGAMHFSFGKLIEHAAKTRNLSAGSIIGSGTVSNEDESVGHSCIVEKRMLEKIKTGEMKAPFLRPNDTVEIEMFLPSGESLFGKIRQKVSQPN